MTESSKSRVKSRVMERSITKQRRCQSQWEKPGMWTIWYFGFWGMKLDVGNSESISILTMTCRIKTLVERTKYETPVLGSSCLLRVWKSNGDKYFGNCSRNLWVATSIEISRRYYLNCKTTQIYRGKMVKIPITPVFTPKTTKNSHYKKVLSLCCWGKNSKTV